MRDRQTNENIIRKPEKLADWQRDKNIDSKIAVDIGSADSEDVIEKKMAALPCPLYHIKYT